MQEEISFFDRATEFAGQYALFSPLLVPVVMAAKWVFDYFQGVNRLAVEMKATKDEMREIKEKQNRMMEAADVDVRVAPVIQGVAYLTDRLDQVEKKQDMILDHLLNRPQNQRIGDE